LRKEERREGRQRMSDSRQKVMLVYTVFVARSWSDSR
jgi:hypothetical protein